MKSVHDSCGSFPRDTFINYSKDSFIFFVGCSAGKQICAFPDIYPGIKTKSRGRRNESWNYHFIVNSDLKIPTKDFHSAIFENFSKCFWISFRDFSINSSFTPIFPLVALTNLSKISTIVLQKYLKRFIPELLQKFVKGFFQDLQHKRF